MELGDENNTGERSGIDFSQPPASTPSLGLELPAPGSLGAERNVSLIACCLFMTFSVMCFNKILTCCNSWTTSMMLFVLMLKTGRISPRILSVNQGEESWCGPEKIP